MSLIAERLHDFWGLSMNVTLSSGGGSLGLEDRKERLLFFDEAAAIVRTEF
jgi:hypothetical protein